MIAAYLQIPIIILLLAVFLRKAKGVNWNDRYNDKSTTSIINGLFVCLVFIHHFGKRAGGEIVNYVGEYMGQLVVVTFLFTIVLISMKVQIQSPFLRWCGEHVAPIYFYQQLSLNAAATIDFGLVGPWRWWLYFIACGFITLIIAALYPIFQVKPDSRIIERLKPLDNLF